MTIRGGNLVCPGYKSILGRTDGGLVGNGSPRLVYDVRFIGYATRGLERIG
jgi:hypothetical protein